MAKIRGLKNFQEFFSAFDEQYVIIGGTAASILMEDSELVFRLTKDIDLVILSHPSKAIANRIAEYVKHAEYEIRSSAEGKPNYYRFSTPKSEEFPHTLEIFAKNAEGLELEGIQHIIPIPADEGNRLSAILLDEEYFSIIKKNSIKSAEGYRIINTIANICMKAKAFKELTERKAKGEKADSKDIEKHRNDILKLALTLSGNDRMVLEGPPAEDMNHAIFEIKKLQPEQVKSIMKDYDMKKLEPILERLSEVFGLKKI